MRCPPAIKCIDLTIQIAGIRPADGKSVAYLISTHRFSYRNSNWPQLLFLADNNQTEVLVFTEKLPTPCRNLHKNHQTEKAHQDIYRLHTLTTIYLLYARIIKVVHLFFAMLDCVWNLLCFSRRIRTARCSFSLQLNFDSCEYAPQHNCFIRMI